MDDRRSLHQRDAGPLRPDPGRRPRSQRRSRFARHQRGAKPGQAAASPGACTGRAQHSRGWDARRLQHDLAGPRPPPRRAAVTLEIDPKHAEVALNNIARAGLADRVVLRLGPALDTLPVIAAEGKGPFDFVFIDADKPGNADYFAWALRLTRRGSVIVVDNVIRKGAVADPASRDPNVMGVRRLNQLIASEPRVSATAVQTVGSKGHDGFALALVVADS
jgi:hypothetical protein